MKGICASVRRASNATHEKATVLYPHFEFQASRQGLEVTFMCKHQSSPVF
jgi:hypothetical protein